MLEYFTSGLIPQLLINGILFGTMYGIAAIGLSLIFGTMRIIFLAQGTIIVLMAYLCFWLFALFSIDPYLSLIIVLPVSMLVGVGFYQGLFRKAAALEDKNTSLLIAVGLMFLVESLMSVLWSPNPRSIRTVYTAYGISAMGLTISFTRLMAFVMALLSVSGVTAFLNRTLVGKAIRSGIRRHAVGPTHRHQSPSGQQRSVRRRHRTHRSGRRGRGHNLLLRSLFRLHLQLKSHDRARIGRHRQFDGGFCGRHHSRRARKHGIFFYQQRLGGRRDIWCFSDGIDVQTRRPSGSRI